MAVSAERWREVACFLADELEEIVSLYLDVPIGGAQRALAEFHALADEDDPEDVEALKG